VRALFDNGWLHLFAVDEEGRMAWRYAGDLQWTAMHSRQVAECAQELRMPAFAADTETTRAAEDRVIALVGERCATLAVDSR
jgi:hypothetical protein